MAIRITAVLPPNPKAGFGNPASGRTTLILPQNNLPPNDFRATLRARWAANRAAHRERMDTMGYLIKPLDVKVARASSVEIPAEMVKELEEFYAYLTEHPTHIGHVTFDTAEERKSFGKLAKAWGLTRDAGTLIYRQLPGKGLTDKELRFTLKPAEDKPETGETADTTDADAATDAVPAPEGKTAVSTDGGKVRK